MSMQCDQIWQYFATWLKLKKSLAIFPEGFLYLQNLEPTVATVNAIGKKCLLLYMIQ